MAQVTIIKDGQSITVDETTPGLFGRLGYHYAGQSSLSGTGTPPPNPAPTQTGTTPLPQTGGSSSPLLSFASSLDQVVAEARKKRNASSLDMMKPFQGTVAASDFNSILGNLNKASDSTSKDLLKRVTDITAPDIITTTSDNGDVHGIDKATGKIVWTAPGVGNKQGGSGGGSGTLINSGALTYTKADYADDASQLESSRGQDGYVDPTIYQSLYNAWVNGGGKINDFIKTYPPEQYVNPDNSWLPPYLRPKKTAGSSNPFAK